MKRLVAPVAVAAVIFLALMCLDRSCQSDAALAQAKAEYDALKKANELYQAEQEQVLLRANETIAQQDATIAAANAAIREKDARITLLSRELADIVGQEPHQPELETEPLVINLRAQVARLSEMFALAMAANADQQRVITSWETKYDAQVSVSESWKRRYESELALRLQVEKLFRLSEQRRRSSRFWKAAAIVGTAAGVAAGIVIAK